MAVKELSIVAFDYVDESALNRGWGDGFYREAA
jgi:molybdopterin/thiamine biosynthesis adenylyltransferase